MFTFQLENDRRTVETSLLFNVNFFSEIRFKKIVDSNISLVYKNYFWSRFEIPQLPATIFQGFAQTKTRTLSVK